MRSGIGVMRTESESNDVVAMWTRVQPSVWAFIASMVPNFHDAEDILQTVALIAIRKSERYAPNASFLSWCVGIARLEVLKWWQRRGRDKLIFDDEALNLLAQAQDQLEPEAPEIRQALVRCARRLTPRAHKMLEMRYLQDLRAPAIAKRLGMSSGAVRTMLHRVRNTLQRCIEDTLQRDGRAAP